MKNDSALMLIDPRSETETYRLFNVIYNNSAYNVSAIFKNDIFDRIEYIEEDNQIDTEPKEIDLNSLSNKFKNEIIELIFAE